MEKILVMMCHSIAQTNISPFFAASGVVLLSPETQVIPETKYILTDASKMSDAERQTSALGNAEGATQVACQSYNFLTKFTENLHFFSCANFQGATDTSKQCNSAQYSETRFSGRVEDATPCNNTRNRSALF